LISGIDLDNVLSYCPGESPPATLPYPCNPGNREPSPRSFENPYYIDIEK